MQKPKSKGRIPLRDRKQANILRQCREGNRQPKAFWASLFLKWLAERAKPIRKTGTVADMFLSYCIAAWNDSNVKFFTDIARTIKNGKEHVHANPAEYRLWLHFTEHPFEAEERSRVFSIGEIQEICRDPVSKETISERTAGRLAHGFELQIRPKGVHGKEWRRVAKFGT
jgi:hypothetical protein